MQETTVACGKKENDCFESHSKLWIPALMFSILLWLGNGPRMWNTWSCRFRLLMGNRLFWEGLTYHFFLFTKQAMETLKTTIHLDLECPLCLPCCGLLKVERVRDSGPSAGGGAGTSRDSRSPTGSGVQGNGCDSGQRRVLPASEEIVQ